MVFPGIRGSQTQESAARHTPGHVRQEPFRLFSPHYDAAALVVWWLDHLTKYSLPAALNIREIAILVILYVNMRRPGKESCFEGSIE